MVAQAIGIIKIAFVYAYYYFELILEATGTRDLLIAGIAFVVIFSVLILPLRGGQAISNNSLAGFLTNKINSHKGNDKKQTRRTDHDD